MSFDFTYAAETDAGIKPAAGSFDGKTKKIEKGLKRLLVLAGVIFAAQLIWLFGISPFIPFSTVEVHSFAGFERPEILRMTGIDETSSYFSTNVIEIQEKLISHLLVESAVVVKHYPDKLSIYLTPRKAVALALTNTSAGQVPLYIDRHGVFFKTGYSVSDELLNLPVLSGFENPRLNMRLPVSLVSLVESLWEISSSSPELLAAISEIRIERKAWEGFDLVVYPVHSSIKVRLENNLTEDVIRYMLLMLNVFESAGSYAGSSGEGHVSSKPREIDFRSGMGSYRIKEQSL